MHVECTECARGKLKAGMLLQVAEERGIDLNIVLIVRCEIVQPLRSMGDSLCRCWPWLIQRPLVLVKVSH